jgi:hypothetical protein
MNRRTTTANPASFNLSGIILRLQVGANIFKAMVKAIRKPNITKV